MMKRERWTRELKHNDERFAIIMNFEGNGLKFLIQQIQICKYLNYFTGVVGL